jgi:hypothetical protein
MARGIVVGTVWHDEGRKGGARRAVTGKHSGRERREQPACLLQGVSLDFGGRGGVSGSASPRRQVKRKSNSSGSLSSSKVPGLERGSLRQGFARVLSTSSRTRSQSGGRSRAAPGRPAKSATASEALLRLNLTPMGRETRPLPCPHAQNQEAHPLGRAGRRGDDRHSLSGAGAGNGNVGSPKNIYFMPWKKMLGGYQPAFGFRFFRSSLS